MTDAIRNALKNNTYDQLLDSISYKYVARKIKSYIEDDIDIDDL